jgi:hypothetical protein
MQWSDIQFRPGDRMLRQFAVLWMIFFAILLILARYRGASSIALISLALVAGAGGGLGLLKPQTLRPLYAGWMLLVFPIGWAVSKIILVVIFYGLFTPIGYLFRLRGRDLLCLQRPEGKDSYWTNKPSPQDVRQYFDQS